MTDSKQIQAIAKEIFSIDCPILDIGSRMGRTGYIDFIDENEFKEPLNKGTLLGRKFISFRANIEYIDGNTKETFTTLFQHFVVEEILWMAVGKKTNLLNTTDKINLSEIQLLLKLLQFGFVDITDEIYENCRITPSKYYALNEIDKNKPKRIYLVSKTENVKEKIEDVMKDLERKVNPKSKEEGIKKLVTSIKTNDPSIILNPMIQGSKIFEERVGRPMTYSEMREMWG